MLENALTFSVIMPAFNAETTISDAIGSVVGQTRADWELIVVNDGSTDGTEQLAAVAAATDPRIRLVGQANAGTAMARNMGASVARGTWWVFLDADDMLAPEYLEHQFSFAAEHPDFDIYSCNVALLLRDGRQKVYWRGGRYRKPFSLTVGDQACDSGIFVMTLIRPSVFDLTGGFRPVYSEDYDFWLRAFILGARHIYNPEVLALYRRQEHQKTTQLVREAESLLDIQIDARSLVKDDRAAVRALDEAIELSEARIERRRLEEALLQGDLRGARARYWASRRAFPGKAKYAAGFAIIMVSPGLYAWIKAHRVV